MFKAIGGVLDWFVIIGLVIIFGIPVFVLTFPFSLFMLIAYLAWRAARKHESRKVAEEPRVRKAVYIRETYRF